jgi:CDP-diacylglycerol--serine O-phosphatidyltransferase
MVRNRRFRRGIYLLPTLFTVGNIFCGYWSLIHTYRGALELGAVLIIIAAVLDGLDGRIARLTGTTSDFGVEFDSLADMVSFGVAPALLAYKWALEPLGRTGWLVAFLFVVCAATRLARFNLQVSTADRRFFVGLPTPSAAGALACVVFAAPAPQETRWLSVPVIVLICALGLLMVSRLRYYAFKDFDLRNRRSYIHVLPLAGVLVAVAVYPKGTLLLVASAYLLSAPTSYAWSLARRMRARRGRWSQARGDKSEVADETPLR